MNITAVSARTVAGQDDGSEPATTHAPLGQDAFMRLLLTQLQNQDPTAPQADGEFLAQLAQFSQLEQLQEMNKKLDAIAAVFSMVGPTTTTESSTTSTATGASDATPAAGSN
ncbi:MAG: flagellar hook assembly protein FlgD [Vicinamibacterales bacterium]